MVALDVSSAESMPPKKCFVYVRNVEKVAAEVVVGQHQRQENER